MQTADRRACSTSTPATYRRSPARCRGRRSVVSAWVIGRSDRQGLDDLSLLLRVGRQGTQTCVRYEHVGGAGMRVTGRAGRRDRCDLVRAVARRRGRAPERPARAADRPDHLAPRAPGGVAGRRCLDRQSVPRVAVWDRPVVGVERRRCGRTRSRTPGGDRDGPSRRDVARPADADRAEGARPGPTNRRSRSPSGSPSRRPGGWSPRPIGPGNPPELAESAADAPDGSDR